ncbi:hypothetical protein BGZ61DRAFT_531558 [Ilyonectria robusta]|uniref:uncharacterized protein n=1 Tax=Ilyonectria robusta TaxID=1079257 RepID=UPI001E8D69FF|nr:uncharacterized protein BGZ61DRAFT_531558 [Ilyonectria robusta]KAH8706364.1 hypothetical protein BGZ61DRAFT_531558 [Ilyonectria robusta]
MADSNSTPALYKLPLELVSAISSFSDVSSLNSISRASKVCRQLFAPYLLEKVWFDGCQASLTCLLRGFLLNPTDAPVIGLRNHIKCASIIVHSSPATWRKAANSFREVEGLPMQILDSIQLMGNLHTLALDLESLPIDQTIDLAKALESTVPWRLRHLRVACHRLLGPAVIEHCCPDTLKILQMSENTESEEYAAAAKHCKGLERLRVYAESSHWWWASLEKITTHFAHLQWLVFSECRQYYFHHDHDRGILISDESVYVSIYLDMVAPFLAWPV